METRAKLGAHNLESFDLADIKKRLTNGTWNGNTYSENGTNFTFLSDGTISIDTNGVNSTGTAWAALNYANNANDYPLKSGEAYKVNGTPITDKDISIRMTVNDNLYVNQTNGQDYEFTAPSFSLNYYFQIRVGSGTNIASANPIIVKPQIRLASDPYTEYTPYVPTNAELLPADTNAVLGAHNLLDNSVSSVVSSGCTYSSGTFSNATQTDSRVANFAVALIKGTSTLVKSYDAINITANGLFEFPLYIPSGTDFDSITIGHNGQSANLKVGFKFNKTGNFVLAINVIGHDPSAANGYSFNNIMIKLASDPSTAYAPYAMTNRELTELVIERVPVPTTYVHNSGTANIIFEKVGKAVVAYWAGGSPLFPAQATDYAIGDIPDGFMPSQTITATAIDMNTFTKGLYLQLNTADKKIHILGYATGTNGNVNAVARMNYFAT